MNEENDELKKLWKLMNSSGWENHQLAKMMFINCSWDTVNYDMIYFILLYTNITPLETLEFASNVININSKFFNGVVGFKKTALNGIKIRWINGDLNDKILATVKEIKKITGWTLLESKKYFDNNIKNENSFFNEKES